MTTSTKRKPAPSKAKALHHSVKDHKPDKPRLSPGRPPLYTPELAERICRRIANGESLRAICDDKTMPDRGTVLGWVKDIPDFSEPYAQARARQQDAFAEDGVYIADTEPDPARARVRVAARQWYAERVAPKKYGQRIEHAGQVDGVIKVSFLPDDAKIM